LIYYVLSSIFLNIYFWSLQQVDTTSLGLSEEDAMKNLYIASMGVYVFRADVLRDLLNKHPSSNDFGYELIPSAVGEYNVQVHRAFSFASLFVSTCAILWSFYFSQMGLVHYCCLSIEINAAPAFQAYLFNDYWVDIGTIKSFFDANLALTEQVCLPCLMQ